MMVNPTYQNQSRLDTGTADVTMNTFRGEGRGSLLYYRGGGKSENLGELMLINTRCFDGTDFAKLPGGNEGGTPPFNQHPEKNLKGAL